MKLKWYGIIPYHLIKCVLREMEGACCCGALTQRIIELTSTISWIYNTGHYCRSKGRLLCRRMTVGTGITYY